MEKCQITLPGGEVCGKAPGSCIHNWQPTVFGDRQPPEKENPAISANSYGGALDSPMGVR